MHTLLMLPIRRLRTNRITGHVLHHRRIMDTQQQRPVLLYTCGMDHKGRTLLLSCIRNKEWHRGVDWVPSRRLQHMLVR